MSPLPVRLALCVCAALMAACAGDDLDDVGDSEATEAAESDSSTSIAGDDPSAAETTAETTTGADDASTDTDDTASNGELFHTCLHYCEQEVACAAADPPDYAVCFNHCMDATAACAGARTALYLCLVVHDDCADWTAASGCAEQASAVADLCANSGG